MRYERPTIEHREPIAAVLTSVQSNVKPPPDGQPSDRNVKSNIRPVTWGDEPVAYTAPAITTREVIEGLLDSLQSNVKPQPDGLSDVNVKEHIVPVRW